MARRSLVGLWLEQASVGDTEFFSVDADDDESRIKFQRKVHTMASRINAKVSCANFYGIRHDFQELTPMVRVEVTYAATTEPNADGGEAAEDVR